MESEVIHQNSKKLLVSVWMVTYNHEAYIAQAIESVLNQQTKFGFHLFIGEDCSTDMTGKICQSYADKFPEDITLIRNSKNVGTTINGVATYAACFKSRAKYVALIEGDDFWTDMHKLQIQVDFLDSNPDFVLTFHNTDDIYPEGTQSMYNELAVSEFTINDFISHTYARTVTVVFRRPESLPTNFEECRLGDSALFIYLMQFGNAKYVNKIMASYRIHSSGLWNGKNLLRRGRLRFEMFEYVFQFIKQEFKPLVLNQLNELSLAYMISSIRLLNVKTLLTGLAFFLNSSFSFKINKLKRAFHNLLKTMGIKLDGKN